MRHRVAGKKLHRPTGQRKALYKGLITDLLDHGRIVTTEAKAKAVRGMAEKVITLGKDGTLQARRQALAIVTDKKVVNKLFTELGPQVFSNRPGGYTRIVKLPRRQGDGAPMALLELVSE